MIHRISALKNRIYEYMSEIMGDSISLKIPHDRMPKALLQADKPKKPKAGKKPKPAKPKAPKAPKAAGKAPKAPKAAKKTIPLASFIKVHESLDAAVKKHLPKGTSYNLYF